MSLIITEVLDKKLLKAFVEFPYALYKNNEYNVPLLRFDEMATLSKDKNPAFDYCEARYWLAYKEGRVVGRIAGIINHAYIEKWKNKYIRFGWFDFENDPSIAQALLQKVENWAKEKGLEAVHGPLGFTDLDHQGTLIQGFEELGTLGALYNHAYYPGIIESNGYVKDADWVEYQIKVPQQLPEKMVKLAEIVQRRQQLTIVEAKKAKEILPYAKQIFELINDTYSHLYGVMPLTEKQIAYYTKMYFSFIKPDYVSLIVDKDNKLAAFGITMPSLSKALQKAKGSLLPFGFIHILRAMKNNKFADLYLAAVRKDLQGKGVNVLLMYQVNKAYIKNGVVWAESNPELEDNTKIQSLWDNFEARQHKRRRCYIKHL
jgi:hypothetical protein